MINLSQLFKKIKVLIYNSRKKIQRNKSNKRKVVVGEEDLQVLVNLLGEVARERSKLQLKRRTFTIKNLQMMSCPKMVNQKRLD